MSTVAVAMVCKTPIAGQSKTRLSPPLSPRTAPAVGLLHPGRRGDHSLRRAASPATRSTRRGLGGGAAPLLPAGFRLLPGGGDLGERLIQATADLLGRPRRRGAGQLRRPHPAPRHPARRWTRREGDNVVLGPALDGGYTLIGLSKPHPECSPASPGAPRRLPATLSARGSALAVANVPLVRRRRSGVAAHAGGGARRPPPRGAPDGRRRRSRDAPLPRRARSDNFLTVCHHAEQKTLAFCRNGFM